MNRTLRTWLGITFVLAITVVTSDAQKFRYTVPGLDTLQSDFIIQGGASNVLNSGESEIIWNNSLFSYQLAFHEFGDDSPVLDRFRNTQFISDVFGFYGISQNGRLDIGLQMKYVRSRIDNSATSSIFKVFEEETEPSDEDLFFDPSGVLDRSFGGIASIGFRFRYKPFIRKPQFVLNGGFGLSAVKDETKQQRLGAERDILDLGFSFYDELGPKTLYFLSGTGQWFLKNDVRTEPLYSVSLSAFLIQRSMNNKLMIYPGLNYGLSFKPSELDAQDLIKTIDFLFGFVGLQYGFNARFSLFGTAGFPLIIDLKNPYQEIVRESYTVFSFGLRMAMN